MRKIEKLSMAIIMVSVLGIFLATWAGKVNAGCVGATKTFNFGDTVTESCVFDGSMSRPGGVTGHGLIIGANDITIDGNGHCLDGVVKTCMSGDGDGDSGVFLQFLSGVTIKNLEIKNFCNGIRLRGAPTVTDVYHCTVDNCEIHDNGDDEVVGSRNGGIWLNRVFNSTISNCRIYLSKSDPDASGPPGGHGIYLCVGDYNLFTGNEIYENQKSGIFIRCAPVYNTISYNYVHGNKFGGIRGNCVFTDYHTFEYNYCTNNEGPGIFLGGSDSVVRYNICTENKPGTGFSGLPDPAWMSGDGIRFDRSAYTGELYRNTCCNNEDTDIWVQDWATITGYENACDTTRGYEDEGTSGCAYACDEGPVANFSAEPVSGLAPLEVQFGDESVGEIDSWSWSFGDGETSQERHPTHIYEDLGSYTVSLTVTGSGGGDTETRAGYIKVTPVSADFSADPRKGKTPLTVQFTDESTSLEGITGWSWDFGDGGTSQQQNPSYIYENPGSYTVSLTVTGSGGSSTKTREDYIEATSIVADFSFSPDEGFTPLTVQFTDKSKPIGEIDTWEWDFGDGVTDPNQNPSHTYILPQDKDYYSYVVTLTVTAGGESDTRTSEESILVARKAVADFSAEPTSGDAPLTVNFTNNSEGFITSWKWEFGDGGTSDEKDPTHTYENPGTYTVSLTAIHTYWENDIETKTDYIVVSGAGTPPIADFSALPRSGAAPLTVNFTDETTGGSPVYNYEWDFDNDGTADSSDANPSHQYTEPGTYTVSLKVTDSDGTEDTETKTNYITVVEPGTALAADFFASPKSGDAPLTVGFSNATTGGVSPYSYEWDFDNDGTADSSDANPSHQYTEPGTYTVSLKVTDSDGTEDTETKTDYITVTEPGTAPVADFFVSPKSGDGSLTVNFLDFSIGEIHSWFWRFGDGGIRKKQNPTYTYHQQGTYTVSLTVSGPHGNDTRTKKDYITVTGLKSWQQELLEEEDIIKRLLQFLR